MIKVKLPKWWTESDEDIFGFTNGETTYCASCTPCFYVECPTFDYEGYFEVSDLEIIGE